MNLDAYRLALAGTGQAKLHALRLLAEGTAEARFRAAVLFHDVARKEQIAIGVLDATQVSPEVRLATAVERCWCLLEGLDPKAAGNAYGEVLAARKDVHAAQATAMTARLDAKYKLIGTEYARILKGLPTVENPAGDIRWTRVPKEPQLEKLLNAFPGIASMWFWRSLLTRKSAADAWRYVRNAAELEPDESSYAAGSLRIVSTALPRDECAAFVENMAAWLASPRHLGASGDVWLFYALAQIDLARPLRGAERKARLERALQACIDGAGRQTPPHDVSAAMLRPTLLAVRLAVQEMLAGREPDEHVLYEAGLGALVVAAGPAMRRDPLKLLRESMAGPTLRAA